MSTLYTIGYTGRTLDEICIEMRRLGIDTIIDVRDNPFSRNPEFCGNALAAALRQRGFGYIHIKEAGSPAHLRRQLEQDHDLERYLIAYTQYLNEHQDVLGDIVIIADSIPACLLCVERDPRRCHRSVLAERARAYANNRLYIHHIF